MDSMPAPRPKLNRREANGLLLMGLGVVIAGLGQFYLSNRISLLDGLIFYAIACFLFVRGSNNLEVKNTSSHHQGSLLNKTEHDGSLSRAEGPPQAEERVGVRAARQPFQSKYIAVLMAIFLIALALRFYDLSTIPYGLWYDEAAIGLEAARVQSDSGYRPMYSSGTTSPPAYLYIVATFQEMFGQDIAALRTASALFGALTVIPFYFLGSLIYGPIIGLLGAFLIAVSRWDLNFSRIAMQGVTTPFFTTLVIALLLLAIRTRNIYLYLVSGACLGLGVWFYSSFLLFPLVVAVYLLWYTVRSSSIDRLRLWGIATFLFVAILIAAPVILYAATEPDRFFSRIGTASALKACPEPCRREQDRKAELLTLWESARKHILMFNYQGDRNGRHNIPGEPMLDPFTAVLAVLGLSYAVAKIREPNNILLLAWLGVMMAPGIFSLSFEAPQGLRAIGTLPAVYLLAMHPLWALMNAYSRALKVRYMLYGIVILAAMVGVTDVTKYFIVQANSYNSWASFSTAETVIARRMAALPIEDYDIGIPPLYHGNPAMRYVAKDRSYSLFDLSNGLPILPTSKHTVIFLSPDERVVRDLVKHYYPKSTCDEITSPAGGPPLVIECLIKQEYIVDTLGLSVKYFPLDGNAPLLTTKEGSLEIKAGEGPYRKEWTGSLYVPEYGEYGLTYTGSPSLELFIDGNKVLDQDKDAARLPLAKGLHSIYASATVPTGRVSSITGSSEMVVKWQRKGQDWEVIPQEYLFTERVQASGLLGRYYTSADWQGPPAFERIDPAVSFYFHILPLTRPYSVEWRGSIYAEACPERRPEALEGPCRREGGVYKFGLRSIGPSQLHVDGRLIVEGTTDDQLAEGLTPLTTGWHQVVVRFQDIKSYSRIYLYWAPPDRGMEIVPPQFLRPW